MASRAGLIQNIIEVWATGDGGLNDALQALGESEIPIQPGETFRVRARTLGGEVKIPGSSEANLGEVIFKGGFKVNLHNPDIDVRALFYPGGFIIGRSFTVDREGLHSRGPRFKPFFYPGVIKPPFARALVNLCRIREGVLLDPTCGTGGILVEAGLLGLAPMGCDAQSAMAAGARDNLAHYGLDGRVFIGDAVRLPVVDGCVSGLVCDMPYGRSSRFAGAKRDVLYGGIFSETLRVVAPGGHAVLCSDMDISELAAERGLSVHGTHTYRVHGSLTRHIIVCSSS
jgi:tRNA (guanine10-N2)-dimethyltransferase